MSERVKTPDLPSHGEEAAPSPRPQAEAVRIGLGLVHAFDTHAKILRLYPSEHHRVTSTLEAIREALSPCLEREGRFEIRLTPDAMICNGETVDPSEVCAGEFAIQLRKRRIRAVRIHRGISTDEIQKLGEILNFDHRRLLLKGGVEVVFPREERPHLEIEIFAIRDLLSGETGMSGLLPDGLEHLRDRLGSDTVRARILGLQTLLRGSMPDAGGDAQIDLIGLIIERLVHVDAWAVDPERASLVVSRFLEILEEHVRERQEAGAPVTPAEMPEVLASALDRADPDGLLQLNSKLQSLTSIFSVKGRASPSGSEEEEESNTSLFTDDVGLRCMAEIPEEILKRIEDVAFDPRSFLQDLAAQDIDVETLGIASEILLMAENEATYRESREGLVRCFRLASRRADSFVRAALYLARELPPPAFEERAALLAEILRQDVDRTAIVRFLELQEDRPKELLRVLEIFLEHSPTLLLEVGTRLLPHPFLGACRGPIEGLLLRALAQPKVVSIWLEGDPEGATEPEAFEFISSRVPDLAQSIVKWVFASGNSEVHGRLLRRLQMGTSAACLDWVALGLDATDRELRMRAIRVLGEFRHPSAVEALRRVLLRQNAAPVVDGEEVDSALRALCRMGTPEAAAEIRSIRSGRRLLRAIYRKEIRQALRAIVEEKRTS